uniref:WGS project CBMG000000000 data, contig CS5907-c001671 n=1 Tax=Fusarium acuminatum CS5907 TaxID=1318461 RepID=A0A090MFA7_9HYPO|nr:unnamed protein product [Fusarium acuminatum CS5907]
MALLLMGTQAYFAIFSDDSDEEKETSIVNNVENPDKKVQAANATLNRLIAGDFLESLGKELGLEVPADGPISSNQDRNLKDFPELRVAKGQRICSGRPAT